MMLTEIDTFELQIDTTRKSGVVIWLTDSSGRCRLRICRLPNKSLIEKNFHDKNLIDITYSK